MIHRNHRVRVVDTRGAAEELRRTFHATDPRRSEQMHFNWPSELQVVGRCLSVTYSSDKWQKDKTWEDYKHVAEAPQFLLTRRGFLIDFETDRPIKTVGPMAELPTPMPQHFAKLAKFLGMQTQLYASMRGSSPQLGRGGEHLLEFRVAHAHLGGAVVPDDAECPRGIGLEPGVPFLFVYTLEDGVCCIVTGTQLDIEKDGITG